MLRLTNHTDDTMKIDRARNAHNALLVSFVIHTPIYIFTDYIFFTSNPPGILCLV